MKGFVDKACTFCRFKDFQRFFFINFFSKPIRNGVACRLAKGEAVHGRGLGAAFISQRFMPLSAKTVTDGNIFKLIYNFFNALAGKHKFIGNVYGLTDGEHFNLFSVLRLGLEWSDQGAAQFQRSA